MEQTQVICNQTQLVEDGVSIIVSLKDYSSKIDKRYLIPFLKNNKYGLINHNYEIVVPAIYDRIIDPCYHENDLIRIGVLHAYAWERKNRHPQTYIRYKYGVINTRGEVMIPIEYSGIVIGTDSIALGESYGHDYTGKHALVDLKGNVIVPFGKYSSFDPDVCGLIRCRKFITTEEGKRETLHGIIDLNGNEILECNHRYISPFYGEYEEKNFKYIKGRIKLENPDAYNEYFGDKYVNETRRIPRAIPEYSSHYGEYAGSYSQDVMGFDDDTINDAFDGDPEAYWNID